MSNKEERKTIEYMFDNDALKFWDKEKSESGSCDFEEIDINDFVDWDTANNKVIENMKERFPKNTIFINIDEE